MAKSSFTFSAETNTLTVTANRNRVMKDADGNITTVGITEVIVEMPSSEIRQQLLADACLQIAREEGVSVLDAAFWNNWINASTGRLAKAISEFLLSVGKEYTPADVEAILEDKNDPKHAAIVAIKKKVQAMLAEKKSAGALEAL